MEALDHARAERLAAAAGIRPETSTSYAKAFDNELHELALIEDERPGSADRLLFQEHRPRSPVRTSRMRQAHTTARTHVRARLNTLMLMICSGLV